MLVAIMVFEVDGGDYGGCGDGGGDYGGCGDNDGVGSNACGGGGFGVVVDTPFQSPVPSSKGRSPTPAPCNTRHTIHYTLHNIHLHTIQRSPFQQFSVPSSNICILLLVQFAVYLLSRTFHILLAQCTISPHCSLLYPRQLRH